MYIYGLSEIFVVYHVRCNRLLISFLGLLGYKPIESTGKSKIIILSHVNNLHIVHVPVMNCNNKKSYCMLFRLLTFP